MRGLYIHIPFCKQKCLYCDFVSFANKCNKTGEYLDALICEMDMYKGETVDTVFIGGGTPSVLSRGEITRLLDAINERFNISDDVEFTMEINPGTVDNEKMTAMFYGGVNRVSVGVQSFNDNELKVIGRIHNSQTAINTVKALKDTGFSNISIDLMMSLPHQTEESFKNNLEIAMTLPVNHISVYSLIIEENTPIYNKYKSGEFTEPDEDMDRRLYKYTKEYLEKNGFCRYEISNYAKAGFKSKHNLKYWNCNEYIGIGLNAHSYIDGVRYYNTADFNEYLSGNFREGGDRLSREDKMGEFIILGLRKCEGVSLEEYKTLFGEDIKNRYGDVMDKFISLGALEMAGDMLRLTDYGMDISNTVMCEFL